MSLVKEVPKVVLTVVTNVLFVAATSAVNFGFEGAFCELLLSASVEFVGYLTSEILSTLQEPVLHFVLLTRFSLSIGHF